MHLLCHTSGTLTPTARSCLDTRAMSRISLRITLNRRGWSRTSKGMNLKPLCIPTVVGRIKRPSLGACHGTQRAARIRHIRLPFG